MDASERARLRALCEAATPGPWRSTWDDPEPVVGTMGEETVVESQAGGLSSITRIIVGTIWHDGLSVLCGESNAALIAAARTALPAALDALDAAEARAAAAERERDAERAEVQRLRDVLFDARRSIVRAYEDCQRLRDMDYAEREARLAGELAAAREDEREACATEMTQLRADLATARAILDGRTEPPTDAEVAAHGNGGIEIARWRFAWAVPGGAEIVGVVSRDGVRDAVRRYPGARWWPLDARDNPCPWPAAP